jgi:hypothetical protein
MEGRVGGWFSELARVENPGPAELRRFLDELRVLLAAILDDDALMDRLCRGDKELRDLARQAFSTDVQPGFDEMKDRLAAHVSEAEAPVDRSIQHGLEEHGLVGVSARFKYNALAKLVRSWRRFRGGFTAGAGLRRMLEGVDVVLDSAVSVLGAGGAIQEFKDTLKALSVGKSSG